MNNKFMYRIIGAISSLMILVSIFVPFFSYYGRTQSIWEGYSGNFILLPILMIVFGVIGLVVFLLNKKIELAYATSGAMIFYSVMRTIEIMNLGLFSSIGVGYYCLIIGSLLTLIMTFLCNMNSKEKVDNNAISQKNMNNIQNENSSDFPAFSVLSQTNSNDINESLSMQQEPVMTEISNQLNFQPDYNQPIVEPMSNIGQQEPVMTEIPDQLNFQSNYNQPIVEPMSNIGLQDQPTNPSSLDLNSDLTEQPINLMLNNDNIINNIPSMDTTVPLFDNQSIESQNFTNNNFSGKYNFPTSTNIQNNETDIFGQPINRN